MSALVYDSRPCELGEGALWHPERGQLFWFDILGRRLLSQDDSGPLAWQMTERCSAAGWVDHDTLLVASETALFRFDIATGERSDLVAMEADNPATRSNDGRADPWGGFWASTMGLGAEDGQGAIYRYYRGELRQLWGGLTIPNAICFGKDFAHYADTAEGRIYRVALDAEGWPAAAPELFLDLGLEGLNPDGAVIDAEDTLWVALWGAGKVAAYAPDGRFLRSVETGAPHNTCPAFGGAGLHTLFVTSALEGLDARALEAAPRSGMVLCEPDVAAGRAEPAVVLD
ncbi:SMP-30/gluconolactonase/LRE family protein [Frigidibacter mobilis]|uniref:SMP-30/gluconolaconase/LRE domain-containing protein n=1 Tax=Frigidibacter mobilis TaxID=1335048 RepID=A0A159YYD4_9RHOB|nr:SMP-30/gluconolactonase/LRE family protein [Frigidibacter mobilis]AMY67492.1 SMP-30/gluconolaconase/LRE domain-containing protein [Frigidibacter mobilis]